MARCFYPSIFLSASLGRMAFGALLGAVLALGLSHGLLPSAPLLTPAAWAADNPLAIEWFKKGMGFYEKNQLPEAVDAFERSVAADPTYTTAWYNLGSVQFRAKRYEQARYAFQKTIWRDPKDMEARYNLAWSLENLGRTDEAKTMYASIPAEASNYAQAQQKVAALTVAKPTLFGKNNKINPEGPTKQPSNTLKKPTSPSSTVPAGGASSNPFSPSNTTAGVLPKGQKQLVVKGLEGPTGMAQGPGGELYVANYTQNSVVKVLPSGKVQPVAVGAPLGGPIGLARDPRNGALYVANYRLGTVVKVLNGQTSVLASGLAQPYYLHLDTLHNLLYVSEQKTNSITRIGL